MNSIKIITVVGARPQFIKASVLSRAILNSKMNIQELILHTGQHYNNNLSDIFFEELSIPRPYKNLAASAETHGKSTGRMIEQIETEILENQPDLIIVYGDTNSTLAGALAAIKLHVPIAHIEAGMRSYNIRMPEEVNRILTDRLSSLLFCPSKLSRENLKNEGINSGVFVVGDIMFDAIQYYIEKISEPNIASEYILATVHRAENTDNFHCLSGIIKSMGRLKEKVIFPLHPRTRKMLKKFDITIPDNVEILEPVSYLTLLSLAKYSKFIMTDSGGAKRSLLSWPEVFMPAERN